MFLRKYLPFVLLLFGFLSACCSQAASDPLKEILDSSLKPSELPLIDKNMCCPVCLSKPGISKNRECDAVPQLIDIKKNAQANYQGPIVILTQSKNWAITAGNQSKKMYITGLPDKKRMFEMMPGKKIFKSLNSFKGTNLKKKFVNKYEKLKSVYFEIQFKELCDYLTDKEYLYDRYKSD